MPIPKTFSAPADETFPALNGYAPSLEDSLRYAVWLMLYADDVNRAAFSYDVTNPDKGVRIRQTQPEQDPETGRIVLPQQLVGVASSRGRFTYEMSQQGRKRIVIAIMDLIAVDSDWLREDASPGKVTVEMRMAHEAKILMRGTLHREMEEGEERVHEVIDPIYTPLDEDGYYDQTQLVVMTTMPPTIEPASRRVFPNPRKELARETDLSKLDPIKDFAVAYGQFATYEIDVTNRENMR